MEEASYCTNTKIINSYTTPIDYWPISLLSILSKVLYHVISDHLYNIFQTLMALSAREIQSDCTTSHS